MFDAMLTAHMVPEQLETAILDRIADEIALYDCDFHESAKAVRSAIREHRAIPPFARMCINALICKITLKNGIQVSVITGGAAQDDASRPYEVIYMIGDPQLKECFVETYLTADNMLNLLAELTKSHEP